MKLIKTPILFQSVCFVLRYAQRHLNDFLRTKVPTRTFISPLELYYNTLRVCLLQLVGNCKSYCYNAEFYKIIV